MGHNEANKENASKTGIESDLGYLGVCAVETSEARVSQFEFGVSIV